MIDQVLTSNAKKLYCGALYDALRFDLNLKRPFVLSRHIKPCGSFKDVLFGPAFTCHSEPVLDRQHIDDSIRIKMFQAFYKGCVQVISSGGYREVAQFGDISARIAKKLGAAGAVIDAPTRDLRIIRECEFPLFCSGVQPIDAYERWQITKYEVPIVMTGIEGDVWIRPGDFIWGDEDGVLVVPSDLISDAIACALERVNRENIIREEISNYDDIQKMYDELGRW